MTKTIVLGDEYDEKLKSKLIENLRIIGATPVKSDWKLAGSQELMSLSVSLRGEVVVIESETYVGLSISGPDNLIDEIVLLVSK